MSVIQMPQADDFSRRVGAEVRAMMGRAQISQKELVDLLGVNQSAISKRLRGVTPWDVNELGKIASYFHITVSQLIEEAEKHRPDPGPDSNTGQTTHEYLRSNVHHLTRVMLAGEDPDPLESLALAAAAA